MFRGFFHKGWTLTISPRLIIVSMTLLLVGFYVGTAVAQGPDGYQGNGGTEREVPAAVQAKGRGVVKTFINQIGGAACMNPVPAAFTDALAVTFTLSEKSHLLAFFNADLFMADGEAVGLTFRLDGIGNVDNAEWFFDGGTTLGQGGQAMWTMLNVPAGTHTVAAQARREPGSGNEAMFDCTLTVFVIQK